MKKKKKKISVLIWFYISDVFSTLFLLFKASQKQNLSWLQVACNYALVFLTPLCWSPLLLTLSTIFFPVPGYKRQKRNKAVEGFSPSYYRKAIVSFC